jgi:fatty-acyl-CoA synthase
MLEQGGIVANVILDARRMAVTTDDIYFSMMPFFHAGGSIFGLLTMLMTGGTLLYTETFDSEIGAELMMRERPTIQITMLASEMMHVGKAKGYVFDSLRFASWPDEISREMQPNATMVCCSFGLTETYGTACWSAHAPDDMENAKPVPLEGNEIRIVDPETGEDMAVGVPGEALISGNLARGYWNKPVETAKAFRDGWLHTEDRCSVDEFGRVTWHGRIKLMLKIGGENVSIEEVERVVGSHPAVLACGVVGVADKRKGEAVCLYLALVPGKSLEEAELRDWLKTRLAHFKLPREIVFRDELPHLGSGKVDRVTLRKWAAEAFPG